MLESSGAEDGSFRISELLMLQRLSFFSSAILLRADNRYVLLWEWLGAVEVGTMGWALVNLARWVL